MSARAIVSYVFFFTCAAVVTSADAAEMALVPVSASGPHTIVGNEIILHGSDQTVTLEIRMSDWDPVGIRAYQAVVDAAGSMSGDAGMLMPLGWDDPDTSTACHDSSDCPPGDICWIPEGTQGFCAGSGHHPEDGAFIDEDRTDYVFHGLATLAGVGMTVWDPLSGAGYSYGATLFLASQAPVYTPPPKYGGTLTLVVPPEAAGTFTMELLDYPYTFLMLANYWVVFPDLTAALITVNPAECGNDICDSGEDAASCPEDCLPPPIPASSAWGLVVLTLLVLSVGKVLSVKRRAAA